MANDRYTKLSSDNWNDSKTNFLDIIPPFYSYGINKDPENPLATLHYIPRVFSCLSEVLVPPKPRLCRYLQ